MRHLLSPPVFSDPERTNTARSLYLIEGVIVPSMTLLLVLLLVVLPQTRLRWLLMLAAVLVSNVVTVALTRRGQTRAASIALIGSGWALLTAAAITAGGIHAQATPLYVLIVLGAGLLLGGRWGMAAGVGCALTGLALVLAENAGRLPPAVILPTSWSLWLILVLVMVAVVALQSLAARTISEALDRARREQHLMQALMDNLPDAIYFKDTASRFIRVNPAVACLAGLAGPEQIVGKSDFDFFTTEYAEATYADEQEIIRTGQPLVDKAEMLSWEDRPPQWLSATKLPLRDTDGAIVGTFGISRNIDERKRAETEIALWKERFDLVAALSKQVIYEYDPATDAVSWSGSLEQVLGYAPDEFSGGGMGQWVDLIHPGDRDEVARLLDEAQQKGRPFEAEYRVRHKDGHYVQIEDLCFFTYDAEGRVTRLIGAAQDISRRVEREKQLRFAMLSLENSSRGVYWLDAWGRILYANPAASEQTGYAADELPRMTLADIDPALPAETWGPDGTLWRRLQTGEMHIFQAQHRHRDGHLIPVDVVTTPVVFEDQSYVAIIVRDISESKQAEAALKDAHDQLAATLQAVPDLLFEVDRAGRVYSYNAPRTDLLYVPPEEFLGKTVDEFLPEGAARVVEQALAEAARQGWHRGGIYALDMPGGRLWFELSIAVKGDVGDPDARFVMTARDITDRQQAVDALAASEEQLRLALDAANDGLWDWHVPTGEEYYSPRWYTMLGYEPGEFPATYKNWEKLVYPPDLPPTRQALDDHFASKRDDYDIEFRALTKSGEVRWIHSRGKVVERDARGEPVRMVGTHADVTDRKQAEEALAVSEERLRQALEAANDGLWDWNMVTGETYYSPRYYTMLGYEPGELPAHHDTFEKLVYPPDLLGTRQSTAEILATRCDGHDSEFRATAKSGEVRWIHSRGKVVERDAEGKPTRMVGTHTDITERKQAEEALRESEARYRRLFEDAPLGIFQSGADGQALAVNPAFARMFGYASPEEVVAAGTDPALERFADPARRAEIMRQILDNPAANAFEVLYRRKDGSTFTGNVHVRPIVDADGRVLRVEGLVEDTTARKRAEDAAREERNLLRTLIDAMPDHIYVEDLEGRNLVANVALAHALGLDGPDDVVGRTEADLDYSPEDAAELRANDLIVLSEGRALEFEEHFVNPAGEVRWFWTTKAPLRDTDGNVIGLVGVSRDVTEHRRAEERLQTAKDYAENLIQTANAIVLGLDEQGNIQVFNRAAEAITGYTKAELSGRNWFETLTPKERYPDVWAEFSRLMAGGLPWRFENPLLTKSGEERHIAWSNSHLMEHGVITGAISFGVDITERKQAEEQLRTRAHQQAAVAELGQRALAGGDLQALMDDSVALLARILQVDFCQALELQPDGAPLLLRAGVGWREGAVGHATVGLDSQAGYTLELGEPVVVEDMRTETRFGVQPLVREHNLVSGMSVVIAGGEKGAYGVLGAHTSRPRRFGADDVHFLQAVANVLAETIGHRRADAQREAALEALRSSEEKFRAIIARFSEGFLLVDEQGRLAEWNQAMEDISGIAREEAIGLPAWEPLQRRMPPERQTPEFGERLRALLLDALRTGEGPIFQKSIEFVLYRPDGKRRTVEQIGFPIEFERGRQIGFVVQDVTERKRLEEQYLQSQKMETVGRLAGGVAHDFNNLLTAIGGYAGLARRRLPADSPVRADIDEVIKAGERAAQLTRQLLTFSRRQIIQQQVIDVNLLILEMDRMLRRLIGEHIEFVTLPARDLWPVKADPGQIEQVLVNLAVNARDAMPEGGKLIVATANVTLDEAFVRAHLGAAPGDYVRLTVSDTGTGMTDEVKAHLFEPFYTTKEKGKGTGLGLATVYGIVKQHQGTIWTDSVMGQGTSFEIYLPRVAVAEKPSRPNESAELPRGTETLLVVEDEPTVRGFTVRSLHDQGYTVLEAANGEEALRVFQTQAGAIDLVVTDVVMPRITGTELANRLRVEYPGVKVLFVSGYVADAEMARQGVLNEGVAFLQKPFTSGALVHKVHALLKR